MSKEAAPRAKTIRCAIYTRKSTEEGLEQDFNSLDAQREACRAYVLSQAGEGWVASDEIYDDGGFSGGNLERPALKRLMREIELKRIDVIVVYKVDRLTRSLADFAKIVDVLDKAGASFVSITQAFNTTTSMGRLTLNVLLSFAQFEREVTGERIRDKIAASKRKGLWMGGGVPMGYDPNGRTLTINAQEAATVRHIYTRYLALGSVRLLVSELARDGYLSKRNVSRTGTVRGGLPFNRGALFHLLANRLYRGEVPHKGVWFPGLHPAIVEAELFEAVQARLLAKARATRRRKAGLLPTPVRSPLTGLIFDAVGAPLTPTATRKGKHYHRYYAVATHSRRIDTPHDGPRRVPALAIEALVADRHTRLFGGDADKPDWNAIALGLVRIDLLAAETRLRFRPSPDWEAIRTLAERRRTLSERLAAGDRLELATRDAGDGQITVIVPMRLQVRGGRTTITDGAGRLIIPRRAPDAVLVKGLRRATALMTRLTAGKGEIGDLARAEGLVDTYVAQILPLVFLAPDIQRAILRGEQPEALMLRRLQRSDIPYSWAEQRRRLGFPPVG
jgi:DNA invertase Pin-like site-specific DNA recombinase